MEHLQSGWFISYACPRVTVEEDDRAKSSHAVFYVFLRFLYSIYVIFVRFKLLFYFVNVFV